MINEGTSIHTSVRETGITVVDMSSDFKSFAEKMIRTTDAIVVAAKVDTAIVRTRRFRANRYHTRIMMATLQMHMVIQIPETGR